LTDIKYYVFISKQRQVQALPIPRALLDEQESFERDGNLLMVHGMVLSQMEG
jgi:hypothetical protein